MFRFARASISGSVNAERSAFSVAMTRLCNAAKPAVTGGGYGHVWDPPTLQNMV